MPEAFSFNREFDFVRLDGLSRVTGRPPHEWDIYVIKELIDNALDADEILWAKNTADFPKIHIKVEYIDLADSRRQLIVQVGNRAVFPAELVNNVLDPGWYTSRKAFLKNLTRGSLGNALKTLLGIPYVLRQRTAGDFMPELKPLSIQCGNKEYKPRFVIDSASQEIKLVVETTQIGEISGTLIRVGIDHYGQEIPRRLEHLQQLAEQYHWCNPHAEFQWVIEIDGIVWKTSYLNNPKWNNKYQGIAPPHWYTPTSFQDLLNALYRKQFGDKKNNSLAVADILVAIGKDKIKDQRLLESILADEFKKNSLNLQDIEADSDKLYDIVCANSDKFDSANLGLIGEHHLHICLSEKVDVEDSMLYMCVQDNGRDLNVPFVLEICAAKFKKGKRQIWTAMNFTPTYGDPFFRRLLDAPIRPEEPVIGLRGFMDAYGFTEDVPVMLYLHLICPTVEHAEYSKTEINHLPFKEVLASALDQILNQLIQAGQEKESAIEQTIYQALDKILEGLKPDERFVPDQLLEKLRIRLNQESELNAWLDAPGVIERLRAYIAKYQTIKPVITHWARSSNEVTVPLHPDKYFSIPAEQVNSDLIKAYHVNKIIYVNSREIEPVVIENGWLCEMDMALLRNPSNPADLESVIVHCLSSGTHPLLILHNADDSGKDVVNQIRGFFEKRKMPSSRIVDLGLIVENNQVNASQPNRLVQFMPSELARWITVRLVELGIPIKVLPTDADIHKDIKRQFEHLLLSHFWDGMSHHLQVASLLNEIDQAFDIAYMMQENKLDQQLQEKMLSNSCKDSYETSTKELIKQFYMDFMSKHEGSLHSIVQSHLKKYLPLTNG